MIRNGKPGDIVYMGMGYGPKARIIKREKSDRFRPKPRRKQAIYYTVEILDPRGWNWSGETLEQAKYLSIKKRG